MTNQINEIYESLKFIENELEGFAAKSDEEFIGGIAELLKKMPEPDPLKRLRELDVKLKVEKDPKVIEQLRIGRIDIAVELRANKELLNFKKVVEYFLDRLMYKISTNDIHKMRIIDAAHEKLKELSKGNDFDVYTHEIVDVKYANPKLASPLSELGKL